MIVEWIINGVAFVVLGVVNLFPTIPQIDTSYLDGVIQVISLVDTFVSVKVVAVCLALVFLLLNSRLVWSVIMWVVRKLPGVE